MAEEARKLHGDGIAVGILVIVAERSGLLEPDLDRLRYDRSPFMRERFRAAAKPPDFAKSPSKSEGGGAPTGAPKLRALAGRGGIPARDASPLGAPPRRFLTLGTVLPAARQSGFPPPSARLSPRSPCPRPAIEGGALVVGPGR